MERPYLFLSTGRGCLLFLLLLPAACGLAIWVLRSVGPGLLGRALGLLALVPPCALVVWVDRRLARAGRDDDSAGTPRA